MEQKTNKPANFKRLYHLMNQLKQQDKSIDVNKFIQGWIWQSTDERTYKKSELTIAEYEGICNEIEKRYGLSKPRHRNVTGVCKEDDRDDRARKRLLAAVHDNIRLKGNDTLEGYRTSPNRYAIGMILRHAGDEYGSFNDIPYARLLAMYNYYIHENKLLRHEV